MSNKAEKQRKAEKEKRNREHNKPEGTSENVVHSAARPQSMLCRSTTYRARSEAATARDEAVALLGPEPVPPIAPIKPMMGAKGFVPSHKPGKKN